MVTAEQIKDLDPICRDEKRRAAIKTRSDINGIDFVEYERPSPKKHLLVVYFLNNLPTDAYDLVDHPEWIHIIGGSRIVDIRVKTVRKNGDRLEIVVDKEGDYSTYWLVLGWERIDGGWSHVVPQLDRQYSRIGFSFKAGCPVGFDCRKETFCEPEKRVEPLIDYLAKDYASFRQLLLDQVTQLNPNWLERSPADLGIALVELLAYTGDYLSYYQDAVANEAFLDTARQRVSAKRHARLIDYQMHDGRNAWTFVHFAVESDGEIPQGMPLITRIEIPLRRKSVPPETEIPESDLKDKSGSDLKHIMFEYDPALAQSRIFETAFPLKVHPVNNEIYLHTWGDLECCLLRGSNNAYVYARDPVNPVKLIRPNLSEGDYLLLEEIKGPEKGNRADADPNHRQVVRIIATEKIEDPIYKDQHKNGKLIPWEAGDKPLPLLHITWSNQDALTFPLCLSARPPNKNPIFNVSVARGNIVLADHGRTIAEKFEFEEPIPSDKPFRLYLSHGPITRQHPLDEDDDPCSIGISEKTIPRFNLECDARLTVPAITLESVFPAETDMPWTPVRGLLDSSEFDRHFVVDIDNQGFAALRFGDGTYGREPAGALEFTATYRIGNGRYGNIGAESLSHIIKPSASSNWPSKINRVRNPLAAKNGVDPETIEEVRQYAPASFHAEQFRAVTEADYASAANKAPGVSGAVAAFRWTGSWHIVSVGIDPSNPDDLVTEPGGRTRLAPVFEKKIQDYISGFRLAGYDLEVRSGEYIPLEIELDICVAPDHFRGDVIEAVYLALSNRINPDGSKGFFHWDNFTFGQPVYLSKLYAAVEDVEGVVSVNANRFHRFGKIADGELESGAIAVGAWQIARLDNDPNAMENGRLNVSTRGGK